MSNNARRFNGKTPARQAGGNRPVRLGYGTRLDMHTHTNYSDGRLEPMELMEAARRGGIRLLAVTDHNGFFGSAAAEALMHNGVSVIPGCAEISARHTIGNVRHKLDLLVYYAPHESQARLYARVASTFPLRLEQAFETIRAYEQKGFAADHIAPARDDGSIASKHEISRQVFDRPGNKRLLDEMKIASWNQLQRRVLGRDPQLTKHNLPATDVIAIAREHGGHVVLAHPGLTRRKIPDNVIRELIDAGLDGIEFVHPTHSAGEIERLSRIAHLAGLVPTLGTDYHSRRQTIPSHASEAARSAYSRIMSMQSGNEFAGKLWAQLANGNADG